MASDVEIAWAAGLFEGEGCIYLHKVKASGRAYVRLTIRMNDLDVIAKFYDVIGVGKFYGPSRNPTGNLFWRVEVNHQADVCTVLDMLCPHFGERRTAKANEAYAILDRVAKRHRGGIKLGDTCLHGHRITSRNHYIKRSRGVEYLTCRQCALDRAKG